jgi:hypothetical protein
MDRSLPAGFACPFATEAAAFGLGDQQFVTHSVVEVLTGRWPARHRRERDDRRLWVAVYDHGLVSQWTDEPRPVAVRWEDLELQHGLIDKKDSYGEHVDTVHLLSVWTHELSGPRLVRFTDPMPGLREIVPFIVTRHSAAIS